METTTMQINYLIWTILAGIVTAFAYDLIRVRRKIFKVSDFVVNVEDVLFFVAMAIIIYVMAFTRNDGKIRWHGIIGEALGIFLYAYIVKNKVRDILVKSVKKINSIALYIKKIILTPIGKMIKFFIRPIKFIAWHTSLSNRKFKIIKNILKIRLKNIKKSLLKNKVNH